MKATRPHCYTPSGKPYLFLTPTNPLVFVCVREVAPSQPFGTSYICIRNCGEISCSRHHHDTLRFSRILPDSDSYMFADRATALSLLQPPIRPKSSHMIHLMMLVAVSMDDPRARSLYDKLRDLYNPLRPCGSSQFPPFEELERISVYCNDYNCRYLSFENLSFKI